MKIQLAGIVLIAAFGYAHAQSPGEVFLCVDEHGNKEYKNTGTTKGCKKVELPSLLTIPAPPKRAASSSASSPDFPKVDGNAQKARDNDRRQILQDELKAEQDRLANLKKEFNSGEPERRGDERNYAKYLERSANMKDDVSRSEKNVEALKRELDNLK
jgi:hypothetical protein